jgi:hypothetical protein
MKTWNTGGQRQRRELLELCAAAFLASGTAGAWPLAGRAQQPARIPRDGWIWNGPSTGNPAEVAGFRQGPKEFGCSHCRRSWRTVGQSRVQRRPHRANGTGAARLLRGTGRWSALFRRHGVGLPRDRPQLTRDTHSNRCLVIYRPPGPAACRQQLARDRPGLFRGQEDRHERDLRGVHHAADGIAARRVRSKVPPLRLFRG